MVVGIRVGQHGIRVGQYGIHVDQHEIRVGQHEILVVNMKFVLANTTESQHQAELDHCVKRHAAKQKAGIIHAWNDLCFLL